MTFLQGVMASLFMQGKAALEKRKQEKRIAEIRAKAAAQKSDEKQKDSKDDYPF